MYVVTLKSHGHSPSLIPFYRNTSDIPFLMHRGPGFHISDFESNRIIGQAQFEATQTVMEGNDMTGVSGSVRSVHVYLDMYVIFFMSPV